MCNMKCWENTYLDRKLLSDVDLWFATECGTKLATAFFKGCTPWNKRTGGDIL